MGLFDFFKKKEAVLNENEVKWNKMWDLWVEKQVDSPYAELMTYQSEIDNGGHSQYFTNVENVSNLQNEMSILETILPIELNDNLQKAYNAYMKLEENEYDEKYEEIIEQCDDIFYENEEKINSLLEEYAAKIEL